MSLPKEVEEFCKDMGRLAIKHEIHKFSLVVDHPRKDWSKFTARWESGRHGATENRIVITTEEYHHTTLDGKDFYD